MAEFKTTTWSNSFDKGTGWFVFARRTLSSLLLITLCPPAAILMWHTCVHLNGSVAELTQVFSEQGILGAIYNIWSPVFFGTQTAWTMIFVFAAFELFLMKALPGKRFEGPVTPSGNIPVYKANGVAAFCVTLFTFWLCSYPLGLFDPAIIYKNFGGLLGALNVFSLGFCLMLYLKGRFKPSSSDSSFTGNFIFDYYWGTELYPRIFGWDVKMFTNCRFGMMGWPVILLSFAAAQHEAMGLTDALFVSVALQLIYIAKFFWWETGYLRSLDIMHDRAGFYICWGCLVWVPAVYTSHSLYMVSNPHTLGLFWSAVIMVCGTLAIFTNYWADLQRQTVRATDGDCKVWGKKPEVIVGNYVTEAGEKKQSLLLASGWWGVSRHFHYIPEVLGAFFWTVPAMFDHFLPYFYVVFLAILLTERAFRDDNRCAFKYGEDWKSYCERVPYKIVPGVV
jgi:7-dehydrocholesterol reductase